MDIQTDGIKRKRFLWGVGLAWTPFLFLIIPLFSAFRGIAREKATGLAVVGGAWWSSSPLSDWLPPWYSKWRQSSYCCVHSQEAARGVRSSR